MAPELLAASSTRIDLSYSLSGTVKVMSVTEPSSEMFCTIMSTTIDSSASAPNTAAATPGLSLTVAQRDLGLGLGERDARNDLLFHDLILIATSVPGTPGVPSGAICGASGSSKVERTTSRTLCAIAISTERIISTLAPSDAISSISSKATLLSRLALGSIRGSVV